MKCSVSSVGLLVALVFVSTAIARDPFHPLETPQCKDPTNTTAQCSKDCGQIVLCLGGDAVIVLDDCSAQNQFCDGESGTCVDDKPEECHIADPNFPFRCTGSGLFPDPFNCSTYHGCAAADQPDISCICDEGQVFDMEEETCVPSEEAPCWEPVACGKLGECGSFPPTVDNPTLFYVCVNDFNITGTRLYNCKDYGSPSSCGCGSSPEEPTTTSTETINSKIQRQNRATCSTTYNV